MACALDLWWPSLAHLELVLLVASRCCLENRVLRVAMLSLPQEMAGLWRVLSLCLPAAALMRPARLVVSRHALDLFRSSPLVARL
jgi:hypothetical protein